MDHLPLQTTTVLLILFTGLSAGLCFTWSNAITPGIGKLDDLGYLSAFQQMNRSIVNPLFIMVFFAPFFLGLLKIYLVKNEATMFWFVIISVALYFFGVLLVTLFGNIPLNDLLDKTDLAKTRIEDLKLLRRQFETKWNRLHLIRTISSISSFMILILILFIKK